MKGPRIVFVSDYFRIRDYPPPFSFIAMRIRSRLMAVDEETVRGEAGSARHPPYWNMTSFLAMFQNQCLFMGLFLP